MAPPPPQARAAAVARGTETVGAAASMGFGASPPGAPETSHEVAGRRQVGECSTGGSAPSRPPPGDRPPASTSLRAASAASARHPAEHRECLSRSASAAPRDALGISGRSVPPPQPGRPSSAGVSVCVSSSRSLQHHAQHRRPCSCARSSDRQRLRRSAAREHRLDQIEHKRRGRPAQASRQTASAADRTRRSCTPDCAIA